jgi:hypothetical protein
VKLLDNKWAWLLIGVGILWLLRKVANQPKATESDRQKLIDDPLANL